MFRTTVAVCVLSCALHLPLLAAEDWPMFGRNPEHTSFSRSETSFERSSFTGLSRRWTARTGAPYSAAPILNDGILYVGDWAGDFRAIRASDGSVLWSRFAGVAPSLPDACFPALGVSGSAAVAGDVVFVPGGDSAVYGFERMNGEPVWRVPLADPQTGAYLWSSLTIHNGYLYAGIASLGDCPLTRGGMAKIDIHQPEHPLITHLMPLDQVGAGVWSTPAIDLSSNTVYVTTGTGEQDPDQGIWGGSLLALSAGSLSLKPNYFLLPSNSLERDIEWGSSPTVFRNSQGETLVAATGKDGVLYALNPLTLEPVWMTKIAIECICPECGCGSLSTPAVDDKRLYVGAGVSDPEEHENGTVYAIDRDTGEVIWKTAVFGVVIAPVTVAGDLVFAATGEGLQVFDAGTGELVWKEEQGSTMFSQPVVSGDTVYCTYVSGEVVAWGL